MKKQYYISFPMVLLYIACALTISDFEIVSVVTMLIWISIPALAIYIRHDFGHVKSRRQKRPSFLSPQLFHHGLSVSHYLYSCLTSFSLDLKKAQTRFFVNLIWAFYISQVWFLRQENQFYRFFHPKMKKAVMNFLNHYCFKQLFSGGIEPPTSA